MTCFSGFRAQCNRRSTSAISLSVGTSTRSSSMLLLI